MGETVPPRLPFRESPIHPTRYSRDGESPCETRLFSYLHRSSTGRRVRLSTVRSVRASGALDDGEVRFGDDGDGAGWRPGTSNRTTRARCTSCGSTAGSLRRRLGRADRGNPAEHRGDRPRRPARAAEDRGALAAHRLRVRPRAGRRHLHRVVVQGRPRRAGAVRPRRRGLDPERGAQPDNGGYFCGFGNDPVTGEVRTTNEWLDILAPKATAIIAVGTCADVRRHPRHGRQPDRRDGRAGLPRLGLEVEGRPADRLCAGLPDPPGQPRPRRSSTCCTRSPGRRR